jgi:hypothetical protein
MGHVIAPILKISADHYQSDSGSLLDRSVETAILWHWQHMEVVILFLRLVAGVLVLVLLLRMLIIIGLLVFRLLIRLVVVVGLIVVGILRISSNFIQFEPEMAIFVSDVLFHGSRGHSTPSVMISFFPQFVVELIKIVAEAQLEILFNFIVRIDLNVIKFSVGWQFFRINVAYLIALKRHDRHHEIIVMSPQFLNFSSTSYFCAVDFVSKVVRGPLDLVSVVIISVPNKVVGQPVFLEVCEVHS